MPEWNHPISGRRKNVYERAELTSLIQVRCWDVPGKTEAWVSGKAGVQGGP